MQQQFLHQDFFKILLIISKIIKLCDYQIDKNQISICSSDISSVLPIIDDNQELIRIYLTCLRIYTLFDTIIHHKTNNEWMFTMSCYIR